MQLVVLGLNHKTVEVAIREQYNLNKEVIQDALSNLEAYPHLHEAVVLSTCNRTEVYAVVNNGQKGKEAVEKFLQDMAQAETKLNEEQQYYYTGRKCIEHLFRVVASLDSMVIGESQILCQVKAAYAFSLEMETTGTILNTLFHRAITTGKRVRAETRISYNAVSVSYAAVELALKNFGDLTDRNVLIYGAGQMAELTARHLLSKGCGQIYVANHRLARAETLAEKIDAVPLDFRQAVMKLPEVDIVITSTGATHYVVKPWEAKLAMRYRDRMLMIIDIAVPRDVDPAVGVIDGIHLYNIDDLTAVVDNNVEERQLEAVKAQMIIHEEVLSLIERFRYLSCQPIMDRITKKADLIRRRMLKRYLTKVQVSDADAKIIEQMTHLIVRKLLRDPMRKLNQAAGTEDEAYYKKALVDLFKVDTLQEED